MTRSSHLVFVAVYCSWRAFLEGNLEENIDEPDEVELIPSTSSDWIMKKRRRANYAPNKSPEEESNVQTERPQRVRISDMLHRLKISKLALPKFRETHWNCSWQLGSSEIWWAKFNKQNVLHWQDPKSKKKRSILGNFCKTSLHKNLLRFHLFTLLFRIWASSRSIKLKKY